MDPNLESPQWSRWDFMKAAFSCGAMVLLGQFGIFGLAAAQQGGKTRLP